MTLALLLAVALADPPRLSELEQLRLRVAQLEAALAERDAQLAALGAQSKRAEFHAAIARHCEAAKIKPEDCEIQRDGTVSRKTETAKPPGN